MGLENPLHIAFLVVVLLLVFGAKRLPEIGRSMGAGMRGFRESISGDAGPQPTSEELGSPAGVGLLASATPTPAEPVPVSEAAATQAPPQAA